MNALKRSFFILMVVLASCGKEQPLKESQAHRSTRISNQSVTAFAQDTLGFIWIGTERGLNRFDSESFHQYFSDQADSTSLPSNYVTALLTDSGGTVWVGTNDGVCILDAEKDCFIRIKTPTRSAFVHQVWEGAEGRIFLNLIESLCIYDKSTGRMSMGIETFDPDRSYSNECHPDPEGNFWSVTPGKLRLFSGRDCSLIMEIPLPNPTRYSKMLSDGRLWLSGSDGTLLYDTRSRQFVPLPEGMAKKRSFTDSAVILVHELRGGNLLVATDGPFFLYAKDYDELIPGVEHSFPADIPYQDFTCLFTDRAFDLWIGSAQHGFANIYSQNSPFNTDRYLTSFLKRNSVTSLSGSADGLLLGTTSGRKAFRYDPDGHRFEWLSGIPGRKSGIAGGGGSIFMASRGDIYLLMDENLHQMRLQGNRLESIRVHDDIGQKVSSIAESPDGSLWVGTASPQVFQKAPGESRFSPIDIGLPSGSIVTDILSLQKGDLVLGMLAANPLYYDANRKTLTRIPIWVERPMADMVTDLLEDSMGSIWLATRSSGVFRYHPETDLTVKIQGLSCEETMALNEDESGRIWISTLSGLESWNPDMEEIRSFGADDGLGGDQFNLKSTCTGPGGTVLFGGTHGITTFDPSFQLEYKSIPLYYEDLRIGGRTVAPGERSPRSLPLSTSVTLGHKDNHFMLTYAALDYSGHGQPHYFYRLIGYQDDWIDNRTSTEVSFSNLRPGRYVLEVKTAPTSGEQRASIAAIPIRIKPAPWNTWWAWLFYVLAILGILYAFYKSRVNAIKEKDAAERARMDISFFNNISHEFRTPLTLISGPVTQLEKTDADPKLIRTVKWNVARMLRLVNQLMDFGKLEQDTLKLQVTEHDVIGLLKQTAGAFAYNMEEKDIAFISSGLFDSFTCPIDADKLDKIVSNLLSNAMKYTPAGGQVGGGFDVVSAEEAKSLWPDAKDCKYLKITISDNGPKIPQEALERIFERYYQVENHHNYGTGLGLYFARRLAVIHHGWLRCDNLTGDGLVFTLLLPAEDVYAMEEKAKDPSMFQLPFSTDEGVLEARSEIRHDKTILLVDDDPGIVGYLKHLLEGSFNIHFAYDGKSALESALNDAPDLVISDVAMPGMDGYHLCRHIKENASLCHLPVILVTAKTTKENQMEGLKQGADAYVTKPFDPDVLLALIDTQLKNRERLRNLLSNATRVEQVQEDAGLSPQDNALMKDLYSLMDEELANQELNINAITDKLYISRTNLYYKIKALTGETPNSFFKKYKLNRAKELLDSGKYNVSEVADMTGWSNSTVFGRNFKSQFGITPGEYLQRRKN